MIALFIGDEGVPC